MKAIIALTINPVTTQAHAYGVCIVNTADEAEKISRDWAPLARELDLVVLTCDVEQPGDIITCLREDVAELDRER